jgi:ATP-dependent RNA helicase DDX3X
VDFNVFFRGGWNDSRNSTPPPPPASRGGYGGGGFRNGGNDRMSAFGGSNRRNNDPWAPSSGHGGGPREAQGYGVWRDGSHIPGARNMRMEKELYGDAEDPSKQHTGINFEKYDDIPVEATGAGVPEPITAFTNTHLDPVLLENISYSRYTTPTPVQKYSIPIVSAGRDLMACAQVSIYKIFVGAFFFADDSSS